MELKEHILRALRDVANGYAVCGIVDRKARVYPLGSDTKVISTVFELIARQAVYSYAHKAGLAVREPDKQNHYPDFTLMTGEKDLRKTALDVKTTYRKGASSRFSYTLGGYASYMRPSTESKNIVFPHSQYREHWVVGFVYSRRDRATDTKVYSVGELKDIEPPFGNVEVFVQEKWRIASDRAGSGNTTNIGSINGELRDFVLGRGPFVSEAEFLEYWRGYETTKERRAKKYSSIEEFRRMKGG